MQGDEHFYFVKVHMQRLGNHSKEAVFAKVFYVSFINACVEQLATSTVL